MEQKPIAIQQLVWFHAGPPRLGLIEEGHFLCLYLNGTMQSKMNQLAPATSLSVHLHPILESIQKLKPATMLQLGLGGGDINRFVTTVSPTTHLLTIEQNSSIIDVYLRFFCLQGKEELLALSAEEFLQSNRCHYAFVFWDIFPLFVGWQNAMQMLLRQKGTIWINLSQPEHQQQLELLLTVRPYKCHQIHGYRNLLYEISSLTEK